MTALRKTWLLLDNYLLARWQKRPSPAAFWYLPEPPNIKTKHDLALYQQSKPSPYYLLNYRYKLAYNFKNNAGIIVLPYPKPIGAQINPEAAFQYTLGLHDQFLATQQVNYLEQFWHYVHYFLDQQTVDGLWPYQFDWLGSNAPWYSALAQARGASMMLRAWLLSQHEIYLTAAKKALGKFTISTSQGGFLHAFAAKQCNYFEEYPKTPTGVINGFMATLLCIWELAYWTQEAWIKNLWETGIDSLENMLPHYNLGWWSLYDHDPKTPVPNVNSPRYHLLELHYLQILIVLSASPILYQEQQIRWQQYQRRWLRWRAFSLKLVRKLRYQ